MKTLILYYSYSGRTRQIAKELAEKEGSDILEIKDIHRPGKLKAYSLGCFAAMRGRAWPIMPLNVSLASYDRIILLSPVWANNPPPAVHAVLQQFPIGKTLSVKMISGSGKCNCKGLMKNIAETKSGTLESFEDIKA